jgi:hypothetical protein
MRCTLEAHHYEFNIKNGPPIRCTIQEVKYLEVQNPENLADANVHVHFISRFANLADFLMYNLADVGIRHVHLAPSLQILLMLTYYM